VIDLPRDCGRRGQGVGVSSKSAKSCNGIRGTSLIINVLRLGPYSRPMPRALRWSYGGGQLLMSEVTLHTCGGLCGCAQLYFLSKATRYLRPERRSPLFYLTQCINEMVALKSIHP